jgi:riboflavin synthase
MLWVEYDEQLLASSVDEEGCAITILVPGDISITDIQCSSRNSMLVVLEHVASSTLLRSITVREDETSSG